jgi:hypothetical protein
VLDVGLVELLLQRRARIGRGHLGRHGCTTTLVNAAAMGQRKRLAIDGSLQEPAAIDYRISLTDHTSPTLPRSVRNMN